MNKKFRVEYVMNQGRKALVLGTQLEADDFKVTESSLLSGVPIEQSLSQPRKMKADGSVDYDTFVFTLQCQSDGEKFQVGGIVDFVEETKVEPVR